MAEAKAATKRSATNVIVTIMMDLLMALAIVCVVHLVIAFFGSLAEASWGSGLLRLTGLVVIPFGIDPVQTPYEGVFVVDAVATALLLVAVQWVLGLVRRNA